MTFPSRVAANVAWLFTEQPWPDRFAAARRAGFVSVEFPWPDDAAETTAAVRDAGLRVAMLNMDAGDLGAGERGWPNDPARVAEWRAAFTDALELATELDCATVNVLAGNRLAAASDADQLACLEDNLRWAIPTAEAAGVTVVTELLNRVENPPYLLATLDDAEALLERLAPEGWRLQLDTWHLGMTDPDVATAVRRAGPLIGHVQLADVPGRHEPGTGALDWATIGRALDEIGYRGAIGLEYLPTRDPATLADAAGGPLGIPISRRPD